MTEDVVISGRSLATALGNSLDETWESLLAGRRGIRAVDTFEGTDFPCRQAARITGIDEQSLDLSRRESRIMDLHSFILMKCSVEAMDASGLAGLEGAAGDTGFFAAIGMVDYRPEDLTGGIAASRDEQGETDYDRFFEKNYREIFPLWPLSMLNNIALCQVAVRLGLRGENTVFSPHADSGLQAVAEATATIAEGRNRAVLAAGTGEKVSDASQARALLHGILDTRHQANPCQPFSVNREGSVLGEGGGVVLLEPRSRIIERGLDPAVAISGYGATFGQANPAQGTTGPSRDAIARAMKTAIESAGRRPEEVDLVIAHGDGTLNGDQQEWDAIDALFSTPRSKIRLYSSKGNLGNLLAGAPLVDLILAERMITAGVIPPVFGTDETESIAGSRLVTGEPLAMEPQVILINAFSYEGQANSLLIEAVG
ncbi:MAG: hypothetical protein GY703_04130 [Gammaproteobacteria bacterium]|nr:hypothetical protein [Gammaproteobacteria bacterium]